ncbi:MAG TPA: TauD/TfdA family dioxygenase [Pyrinomonadaceae bacterium]|jgi:alpha-ketoglutarate-dependent taurine dioxygenase
MRTFATEPLSRLAGEDFGCVIRNRGGGISDVDRDEVISLYKRHGAVLFRGFELDGVAGLREFTEKFCGSFITYPSNKRIRISDDDTVQSVDCDMNPIKVHSELSFLPYPLRPEVSWFYCIRPASAGGQTTLCDGLRVARALSAEARAALESQPIKYVMVFPGAAWQRYFHTSEREEVTAVLKRLSLDGIFEMVGDELHLNHVTRALGPSKFCEEHVFANNIVFNGPEAPFPTFEDGRIIPAWVYYELDRVAEELTVEVDWEANDLLMFDNTRVLHGRREVFDASRLIYTRFGAVNF